MEDISDTKIIANKLSQVLQMPLSQPDKTKKVQISKKMPRIPAIITRIKPKQPEFNLQEFLDAQPDYVKELLPDQTTCNICSKTHKLTSHLRKHLELGKYVKKCGFCGTVFGQKCAFDTHFQDCQPFIESKTVKPS